MASLAAPAPLRGLSGAVWRRRQEPQDSFGVSGIFSRPCHSLAAFDSLEGLSACCSAGWGTSSTGGSEPRAWCSPGSAGHCLTSSLVMVGDGEHPSGRRGAPRHRPPRRGPCFQPDLRCGSLRNLLAEGVPDGRGAAQGPQRSPSAGLRCLE